MQILRGSKVYKHYTPNKKGDDMRITKLQKEYARYILTEELGINGYLQDYIDIKLLAKGLRDNGEFDSERYWHWIANRINS